MTDFDIMPARHNCEITWCAFILVALSCECLSNADEFQQPAATFPVCTNPDNWCVYHQTLLLSVLSLLTNFCNRIALASLLQLLFMHARSDPVLYCAAGI